ncbi:hypothetical protein HDU93_002907 [Gonapodya sp. JEL0774]|nr:hypothetical protein HDU93_002907 [Gonapodya sp. JEL0774]
MLALVRKTTPRNSQSKKKKEKEAEVSTDDEMPIRFSYDKPDIGNWRQGITKPIPPESLVVILAPRDQVRIHDFLWMSVVTSQINPRDTIMEGYYLQHCSGETLSYLAAPDPSGEDHSIEIKDAFLCSNGTDPVVLARGIDYKVEGGGGLDAIWTIGANAFSQLVVKAYPLRCLCWELNAIQRGSLDTFPPEKFHTYDLFIKRKEERNLADLNEPFPTTVRKGDILVHIQRPFDVRTGTTFWLAMCCVTVLKGDINITRMRWYRQSLTRGHAVWEHWSYNRQTIISCEVARDPKDPSELLVLKKGIDFTVEGEKVAHPEHAFGNYHTAICLDVPTSQKGRAEYLELAALSQHWAVERPRGSNCRPGVRNDNIDRFPLLLGASLDCTNVNLFPSMRYPLDTHNIRIPDGVDLEHPGIGFGSSYNIA